MASTNRRQESAIQNARGSAAVSLIGGLVVTSVGGVNAAPSSARGSPSPRRTSASSSIRSRSLRRTSSTPRLATGPCGALLGTGANQIPSPLLPFGLRTVDGSCNNLIAGQENVRCCRPGVPSSHDACVQRRRAAAVRHRRPRSGGRRPTDQLRADHGKRVGLRATNGQQPDRRPDLRQPLRSRRRRVPGAHPGQLRRPGVHRSWCSDRLCSGAPDAVHSQRDDRRRPVAAVQRTVHDLRPVLRSRPRQDHQRRRGNCVRTAEGRRPVGHTRSRRHRR